MCFCLCFGLVLFLCLCVAFLLFCFVCFCSCVLSACDSGLDDTKLFYILMHDINTCLQRPFLRLGVLSTHR